MSDGRNRGRGGGVIAPECCAQRDRDAECILRADETCRRKCLDTVHINRIRQSNSRIARVASANRIDRAYEMQDHWPIQLGLHAQNAINDTAHSAINASLNCATYAKPASVTVVRVCHLRNVMTQSQSHSRRTTIKK